MKNMLWKIGACAVLLLVAQTVVICKDWRAGIVLLKSTQVDVERVFGVPNRSSEFFAYYKLSKDLVVFHFQTAACDSEAGKFGLGWNVPPGTVVGIGVIPKGKHRKEEYLFASDSEVTENGAGFSYYADDAAGLSIETYENLVTLIDYYPGASQDNLQCPRIQKCCFDVFPLFDEYKKQSFENEKARLDNFLIRLNQEFGRGIIEVVGPSRRIRQERMKLAARVKRYLVIQRGFEPERLLLVDGGFRESAVTRLSRYSIGGFASRIHLSPERDSEIAAPNERFSALVTNTSITRFEPTCWTAS